MALVTTIVPVFNGEEYIGKAIQSALNQEQVEQEIIVLDDGSTDQTWDVIQSFGDAIRTCRLERGGPYRARNEGASMAKGDWLAFLDADDEWEPNKLAEQLASAESDTALSYTDCRNIGEVNRVRSLQSDNCEMHEGQIFQKLLVDNFISLSSVLIRREWFENLGGFSEERTGIQDWDLWLRVAANEGIIRLCREPLTLYRHHAGQMSKQLDDRLRDRLKVLEHALSLPAAHDVAWREKRRAYAKAWKVSAWQSSDDRWQAVKWYLRAACYWPFDVSTYKQIIKCMVR